MMDLTKGGSVGDELKNIPNRTWWKVTFAIPALLFLVLGMIDLLVSQGHRFQILLIGLMLGSSQLANSVLKKAAHKTGAQTLSLIFAIMLLYQLYGMK